MKTTTATATEAKPITIELAYERSTKGTHVFTASDPGAAVTTLYVGKRALGDDPPKQITLSIAITEE